MMVPGNNYINIECKMSVTGKILYSYDKFILHMCHGQYKQKIKKKSNIWGTRVY